MGIKVGGAGRFYVALHAAKSRGRMAVCSFKLVKPLGNLGCGAILHQKLPKLAPNCSGWWKLAHNMRRTCRHNMASFPAQLFCSSFHHHIALVCAKTQGLNAHLVAVLDFFLDFQRKNGFNASTCLQLFRNFWILTWKIDFFGCSIKSCL